MSQRIRYIKTGDNEYSGTRFFTGSDGLDYNIKYKVADEGHYEYLVEDLNRNPIKHGKATSSHDVKLKIKKVLVELGCQFSGEKRKGRYED